MLTEKKIRRLIRGELFRLVSQYDARSLNEQAVDASAAGAEGGTEESAEDKEKAIAAKGKIERALALIFPDETFKLPSTTKQLKAMTDMFRTAIESAQAGKAHVAALKTDKATATMQLGDE